MDNKFHPGNLWFDDNGKHINAHGGGILFHENVYYWFGEHKIKGKDGNLAMVGVHVYSSSDLYNWRDEGIALPVSDDPSSEITRGCVIERPKVVYCQKTRQFVMWFHLEFKDCGYKTARSGVAVADNPKGPYRFLNSVKPNAGRWPKGFDKSKLEDPGTKAWFFWLANCIEGGQDARDMTLFADDDGRAYHIFSSENNETLHISELSEDFLSHTGEYSRMENGAIPGNNESPAVFKHKGTYWMIASGCTGWKPNAARLYMSEKIHGPWYFCGNPCAGEGYHNTFGSQSTFVLPVSGKDNSFIFMADLWHPENPIDGRYVWLPIRWKHGHPIIEWMDEWDLSVFDGSQGQARN